MAMRVPIRGIATEWRKWRQRDPERRRRVRAYGCSRRGYGRVVVLGNGQRPNNMTLYQPTLLRRVHVLDEYLDLLEGLGVLARAAVGARGLTDLRRT